MKTTYSLKKLLPVGAALLVAMAAFVVMLQTPRAIAGEKVTTESAATSTTTSEPAQKQTKGGSQLWSENCARCHNMRSPSSYSDGEWEVVMHHMRVRARLTPEEHKAITEFLKSGN
jgi:nitrate/TMAO reductase-like tetraheme cytochrome c subunit